MSSGSSHKRRLSRRRFLQSTALAAGGLVLGGAPLTQGRGAAPAPAVSTPPNILLIMADQLSLDALSGHGCTTVKTPNIDRLLQRGTSFRLSYSSNPVCSPARSSILTGRMPVETGVTTNGKAIKSGMPNIGQWFKSAGYETVYCGKWHLGKANPNTIGGFTVLPSGNGQGDVVDSVVSRNCEAYLRQRSRTKPFLLVSSLTQPHDICFWPIWYYGLVPSEMPYPQVPIDAIPQLPPSHGLVLPEPAAMVTDPAAYAVSWTETQWRYFNWIYMRQVEMLDGDVGKVLDALESSGQADNTIIVFTSDHGESRGRHMKWGKWFPYDESARVPLMFCCPGRIAEGLSVTTHLVSGIDIMPTLCDLAGIGAPPLTTARSLRQLLEQQSPAWRSSLVIETQEIGRTVRSNRYKYVDYKDDPQKQLFDMETDPWETVNLYGNSAYSSTVASLQAMLAAWNGQMILA